jgi:protein involved in polysaccharide export with SLBB domain
MRTRKRRLAAFALLLGWASVAWGQSDSRIGILGLGEPLDVTRPAEQIRLMQERHAQFLTDGAVDPDRYLLGPGDLLGLEVIGAFTLSAEDVIGADGSVTFPQLGTYWLGGLTLSQARARISRGGEGLFRGAQAGLLLKSQRTFKVFVSGLVGGPGTQAATATTRLSEVVQASGGFRRRADIRNVRITHRDGSQETADLLPFLLAGDLGSNPTMRDGDVVLVSPRTHTVEFSGPVLHPGKYDYAEGDELGRFLGWLRLHPRIDPSRATIQRYTDMVRWDTLSVDLAPVLSGEAEIPLRPGDRVLLRGIADWHTGATAEVRGAVRSPGRIPVVRGEITVGKAVRMAGGFLDDAIRERVILGRPFLPDSTVFPDPSPSRNFVEGLTTRRLHEVVVDLSHNDGPVVDPGDIITVPRIEEWVEVLGQVKRPGFYNYHPDWKTEDYIEAAGGYAKLADKSKARLSRGRFGDIGYAKDVDAPAPGDVIWVPEKMPLNFWTIARDILSVTSQAVALVLVAREVVP